MWKLKIDRYFHHTDYGDGFMGTYLYKTHQIVNLKQVLCFLCHLDLNKMLIHTCI